MMCGLPRVTSLKKTDCGSGVKSLQCSCSLSGFHSQPICSSSHLTVTPLTSISKRFLPQGDVGKLTKGVGGVRYK